MGGRILRALAFVVALGDDTAAHHHHGPARHVTVPEGSPCLAKRGGHVRLVVGGGVSRQHARIRRSGHWAGC